MSIVSAFCKKGGVGKSTIVGFIAHHYATLGKKVLIISADDQNSIFKIFVNYDDTLCLLYYVNTRNLL